MWVQPEITQKLYVALWAAFLASCFFPYRLVGLAVGKEKVPLSWESYRKYCTESGAGSGYLPFVHMDVSLLSPQASTLASSFS